MGGIECKVCHWGKTFELTLSINFDFIVYLLYLLTEIMGFLFYLSLFSI